MKARRNVLMLLLLLGWLCLGLAAQDARQATGGAVTDTGQALPVPSPLNTGAYSLAFTSELEQTNYLDGGISIGSTFDDNLLNTSENTISDFGYSIRPHIALRQSRGRLNWLMNYAGGFTIYQRISAYNKGSHDFSVAARYGLTPHVTLMVRDHFFMTTGFFDQVSTNPDFGTGSVLQQPNRFAVVPLATQTSNLGSAAISYQFTVNSSVGASGTFYQSHYGNATPGSNLLDTHSQEAEAFYNHRITPKNTLGITYRFQRFTFDPVSDETQVHSVLLVHTLSLTSHMSLSIFAGPEHTNIATQVTIPVLVFPFVFLETIPISENSWSVATGANYQWNGQRTSVMASFSHTVNDGGGLVSAVQLTGLTAAVRRQLTRSVSIGVAGSYGINDVLNKASSPYSSFKTAVGSLSLSRQLASNLDLSVGYSRVAQQYKNNAPGLGNVDHNRAWVSLSYGFSRPIGR